MMIQFQTQVEFYENHIPVQVQIFITRGLFALTTTSELNEIRSNLTLKLPVLLKRHKIACSKLKIRISTNLPIQIAKCVNLYTLESPIIKSIIDQLSSDLSNDNYYKPATVSLSNQTQGVERYTPEITPDLNLQFALSTLNLLQKFELKSIFLVDSQHLSLALAKSFKSLCHPQTFIFNFYKYPDLINHLVYFFKFFNSHTIKYSFIGIENLTKFKQETLYQLVKNNLKNCLFFIKPCRCGNFMNNCKQCVCHSLIRSRNMDNLSGELISAIDFTVNFFESSTQKGLIVSDFFFTTLADNVQDLDKITHKDLESIYICSFLQSYIEDLYSTFDVPKPLIKSLVTFSSILAYLRGRDELLFGDIFDVINLQSNWYKYAKDSKFIQHRPLA